MMTPIQSERYNGLHQITVMEIDRIRERMSDVVMMLDAPDAYNREYIAAVCRSILSSISSGENRKSEA